MLESSFEQCKKCLNISAIKILNYFIYCGSYGRFAFWRNSEHTAVGKVRTLVFTYGFTPHWGFSWDFRFINSSAFISVQPLMMLPVSYLTSTHCGNDCVVTTKMKTRIK